MEERSIQLVKEIRDLSIIQRAQIADIMQLCQDYLDWVGAQQEELAKWHDAQRKEIAE